MIDVFLLYFYSLYSECIPIDTQGYAHRLRTYSPPTIASESSADRYDRTYSDMGGARRENILTPGLRV